MSLWEFIQKRCELKNIKPFDLVDEGISSASLYRMQDGGTPGERIKKQAFGCVRMQYRGNQRSHQPDGSDDAVRRDGEEN